MVETNVHICLNLDVKDVQNRVQDVRALKVKNIQTRHMVQHYHAVKHRQKKPLVVTCLFIIQDLINYLGNGVIVPYN